MFGLKIIRESELDALNHNLEYANEIIEDQKRYIMANADRVSAEAVGTVLARYLMINAGRAIDNGRLFDERLLLSYLEVFKAIVPVLPTDSDISS